ncbi:MAG: MobQ family relaxase [Pseudomonadota bacterium]
MADYRLSANIIGRSSGRSSVAAAAYRAGEQLHDERQGLDHDYTRKKGVLHSEILAPDNAPDWMKDRAKLWNAVEAVERRKDAQLAREIQLSLPHELDEQQNKNLVLGFIQSHFVDRGMIADIAIHAPDRQGDQRNIHAHVMLTTRVLTSDGFGNKNRDWNTPDQLNQWREAWADHQNHRFKTLGMEQCVDHRSLDDQGIDREPTQHLGPVANDMERKGKDSRIGDENRERQQRNAERATLAQEAAKTSRALAEEKTRQEEIVAAQKVELESHLLHTEQLPMERRHDLQSKNLDAELERRNGERRQQLEAEQQRLDQQLQADGLRKLMRDLLGKTRRDQEQLQATQLNLEDIRMREAEERQALQARQDAERQAQAAELQDRENAYALKLEQDRQDALQQVKEASPPVQEPTLANDRTQAAWSRAAAQEQDNRSQGREDFQKAAVGAPEPSPAPDAKQKAIDEHKDRIRQRLAKGAERDKGGYGYD